MKRDRQDFREMSEILVIREDRALAPHRDGAHQEIRVRTLNALLAATVVERCGFFMIFRGEREVREGAQVFADSVELRSSLASLLLVVVARIEVDCPEERQDLRLRCWMYSCNAW